MTRKLVVSSEFPRKWQGVEFIRAAWGMGSAREHRANPMEAAVAAAEQLVWSEPYASCCVGTIMTASMNDAWNES